MLQANLQSVLKRNASEKKIGKGQDSASENSFTSKSSDDEMDDEEEFIQEMKLAQKKVSPENVEEYL